MKNKKFWRTFAALCTSLVLMGGFSVTAFAQGTNRPRKRSRPQKWMPPMTAMWLLRKPRTVRPLTPEGNAALVDDFGGNKQLITITTKAGNYFYILIDRANEDKETAVHFLNQVDDADLAALTEEGQTQEETPAVCTCTEKCEPVRSIQTVLSCSVNMTECGGKERNPRKKRPRRRNPKKRRD